MMNLKLKLTSANFGICTLGKIYILLSVAIVSSCGSANFSDRSGCSKLLKNDFLALNIDSYKITVLNKSEVYNQLKFYCVEHPSYTSKLMYDNFGFWNDGYVLSLKKDRMLVWKNVDLFSNGKKYSIYTSGLDDQFGPLFSAVMVFDEHGNDMLAPESEIKESLVNYFTEKIKNLDDTIDFLREYYTAYNPAIWKKIIKRNPSYN